MRQERWQGGNCGKKGKQGGRGGAASSLEEEDWQEEPEEEVGGFSICALDVCALATTGSWQKFNLDTGAAITAFPQDQPGILRVAEPSGRSYKTASGEIVEDQGEGLVKGAGEDTVLRTLRGRIAPVHKPLVSAAAVRKKQNHIWIGPNGGGAIVPSTHAAAWHLKAAEKAMHAELGSCTW